ncbi:MAG: type II toxin-antitoxin system RelE/ParE family toxin [Patescibacteria group bacterium]
MKKLAKDWDLQIDPSVYKALKKIPNKDSEYIWKSMNILRSDPYIGDTKKLKGESNWRKRIGNYRIFYEILTKIKTIIVFDLRRRDSQTY